MWQLRLLLWKDFLLRKRKPVSVGAILWAAAALCSLVIVRFNVDREPQNTCVFPARALPSAGLVDSLQSLICSVNNECTSVEKYEPIPSYKASRFKGYKEQIFPLLENPDVLEVGKGVPKAARLLTTVARTLQSPTLTKIIDEGLTVSDLFQKPKETKKYLHSVLKNQLKPDQIDSIFKSELNLEYILELVTSGQPSCDNIVFYKLVKEPGSENTEILGKTLCELPKEDLQEILKTIVYQVNIQKFTGLVGEIFEGLKGDKSVLMISNMLGAVLRLTDLKNYWPSELNFIGPEKEDNFSYAQMDLIINLFDSLEPIFNKEPSFIVFKKSINQVKSYLTTINSLVQNDIQNDSTENNSDDYSSENNGYLNKLNKLLNVTLSVAKTSTNSFNPTTILEIALEFTSKILPTESRYKMFYYLTLTDKMMTLGKNVAEKNINMERLFYETCKRHPNALEIVTQLGPDVVSKFLDALSDSIRIQILTRKIFRPGQMFCDTYKIQTFLKISQKEAAKIKPILCSSTWKSFISDVVNTFGVNFASKMVDEMSSMIISDTLGNSVEDRFITIEKMIDNIDGLLKFISNTTAIKNTPSAQDWKSILPKNDFEKIENVFKKRKSWDVMLVTVHTAVAREIISKNSVVEGQLSPMLIKLWHALKALGEQIRKVPLPLFQDMEKSFKDLVKTSFLTLKNQTKTINFIFSDYERIFCDSSEECTTNDCIISSKVNEIVEYPPNSNTIELTKVSCKLSKAINDKLNSNFEDDIFLRTVKRILDGDITIAKDQEVDWNSFIKHMQDLYKEMSSRFNFLLSYLTDKNSKSLQEDLNQSFSAFDTKTIVKLSTSLFFRVLDTLNSPLFQLKQNFQPWKSFLERIPPIVGLLHTSNLFVQTIDVSFTGEDPLKSAELQLTTSKLNKAIYGSGYLLKDIIENINNDDVDWNILRNSTWPCKSSEDLPFKKLSTHGENALKSIQDFLCLSPEIFDEWQNYSYISELNSINGNVSTNVKDKPEHEFLILGSKFNNFVDAVSSLSTSIKNLMENKTFSDTLNSWNETISAIKSNETMTRTLLKIFDISLMNNKYKIEDNSSTVSLWEHAISCKGENCSTAIETAIHYSFRCISQASTGVVNFLIEYFGEISSNDANILQVAGFTKRTGLYVLYSKFPQIIHAATNSYLDHDFVKQIYTSIGKKFWDCERILKLLVIEDSGVTTEDISLIKTYICPSILHWVSLPIGENALLDIFSKSQYVYFGQNVNTFNATFENLYNRSILLTSLAESTKFSGRNFTIFTDEWIGKMKNISYLIGYKGKLENTNRKDLLQSIYFKESFNALVAARFSIETKKIINGLNKVNESGLIGDEKEKKSDFKLFKKLLERRFADINKIFIYATIMTISNSTEINIMKSLTQICDNQAILQTNLWIEINNKTLEQLCQTNYKLYLQSIPQENDQISLVYEFIKNIQNVLNKNSEEILTIEDIANEILNNKPNNSESHLTRLYNYQRELSTNGFLQYLDFVMQHRILQLNFVSGDEWWSYLKEIYTGPLVTNLIEFMENIPDTILNILKNLSQTRPIRLLKDINFNNTELLCAANISEYIPDNGNYIRNLKSKACSTNASSLYNELKPLLFAAYIYDDDDYELPPYEGDQVVLDRIILLEKKLLNLIENDIKEPVLPKWIDEDHKNSFTKLNLEDMKTEILNFVSHNFVDVATLFGNSSLISIPSSITPWIKQINLQLIKSDEYTVFICDLPHMNESEIQTNLIETFHWDLAIDEIASRRNYTWIELNKALNDMIDLVKMYSQDSYNRNYKKLQKCLFSSNIDGKNSTINTAALYLGLGSKVMKIIQIFLPHVQHVKNVKENYQNHKIIINIMNSITTCLKFSDLFSNITLVEREMKNSETFQYLIQQNIDLNQINNTLCKSLSNCNPEILHEKCSGQDKILKFVNMTIVNRNIMASREKSFWEMKWMTKIVSSLEMIFDSFSQILLQINKVDIEGVLAGKIQSTVDFVLLILNRNFTSNIHDNLDEILMLLEPVVKESNAKEDMKKIIDGLDGIKKLKENLLSNINIDGPMNTMFNNVENLQQETRAVLDYSVSNIGDSRLQFKTILNSDDEFKGIKNYICNPDLLKNILVSGFSKSEIETISEKLCNLNEIESKDLTEIITQHINTTFFTNMVTEEVVKLVMDASNLTVDEGKEVVKMIGKAIKIAPTLKESIEKISESLSKEPVFASLRNASDLSSLLSRPVFLKDIGNMMCGKPFYTNVNRFYRTIAAVQDTVVKPDPQQLKSLPTNYCKSLYQQVINMQAGKILWSYMKPLIMGKILYTPPSLQVDDIIKNVNKTFESIVDVTSLLSGISDGFYSLDEIKNYRGGLKNLQKLAKQSFLTKLLKFEGGDFSSNDINFNIDETLDQFNDDSLGKLLQKASQIVDCISLNRFVAVENELELEKEASRLAKINEFLIGIVFLPQESHKESKKSLTYKIRMDIDNVPSTSRIKNQFWFPGPDGDFLENLRYFRGFIQIQDMIDKAIINSQSKKVIVKRDTEENPVIENNNTWATYSQQMPYPCWISDEFQRILYESQALIIAFFFCLILSVSSISRNIVWEKESGNTDLMCIMGMKREWHTISWLISSAIEVFIAMVGLCCVLKFGDLLPKSDPFLLLLFLINFGISITAFSYMLTGIFKSASLAAVSGAILYLITFMPYILIISMEVGLSLAEKLLTSLSMSTGFCYGVLFIARFEVQGVGLQWNNVWVSPQPGDPMNVGLSILIVLFDTLLYCFIGWMINHYRYRNVVTSGSVANGKHFKLFQGPLNKGNLEVGVSIKNLSKTFNNRVKAVNNVSLELYKSQITTLLGHNGAGKTTLIKILTGVIEPDEGEIIINKNESNKSMKNHIGLCPQSDVLLECLSAREHLSYYAQLKTGLKEDEIKNDVNSMIKCLHLDEKLCNEPVYKLSGGTRRRLSVGLAFVTNPNLVILDEPSSGVDPVARRDIWSMICNLREGRTVLLTTHHLDEAELLSDNLLIMHQGKLCASGSPLDLKHKHGDGYKLTVSYPPEMPINYSIRDIPTENINDSELPSNIGDLMEVVKKSVPNAKITDVHHSDIDIILPFKSEQSQANNFYELSSSLENQQSKLNYTYFSMDCSTLEHVFIKICDSLSIETASNDAKEKPHRIDILAGNHLILNNGKPGTKEESMKSDILPKNIKTIYQIGALLQKRYLHYKRDYRLLLNLFVLPIFFAAIAMGFSLIRPPADSEQPLVLSSKIYSEHSAEFISPLFKYEKPPDSSVIEILANMSVLNGKKIHYMDEIGNNCECENNQQVCKKSVLNNQSLVNELVGLKSSENIVKWSIDTHQEYIEKRYGGWSSVNESEKEKLIMWYNNKGHHALPSYLNTLNSAIYKKETNDDKADIVTYNHPLKLSPEQLSRSSLLQHVADVGISVILMIGFSLVTAAASVYLVPERTSQQKRLQLLSGVSPFTYWFASLLFDMGVVIVVIVETVIVLEIFGLPVYVSRSNLISVIVILFVYGLSSSSLIYILEKLFVDGSLANMIIFCSCVFIGATFQAILLIIDILSKSDLADDIRWYLHKIFLLWPQFALGDALVQLSANTIQADILKRFGMDTYKNPLLWTLTGRNCFALFATMFLFFSINLLIEYNWFSWLYKRFKKEPIPPYERGEDRDVLMERNRVETVITNSYANSAFSGSLPDVTGKNLNGQKSPSDVLLTVSLYKEYQNILGKKIAVKNITFGVKTGECFGLLGINGAGKSTTFKMLTGEVLPSSGNIYINGELLKSNELYNGSISYCPQNDALDPLLTLEEHLHFYCKLRQIKDAETAINESLHDFDLKDHTKQLASALSGGNKRKLCTAIALLGEAPLVLLDEPTSGMDPRARERAGIALMNASKTGRALLLSSHSLPQCERLCDKAALIHNGKMLAIGTPTHLKNRFGRGYIISVRLENPDKMGELLYKFGEYLPESAIQACHHSTVLILVGHKSPISLSRIFEQLEKIKNTLPVSDYTINRSSLDQVFVHFAQNNEFKKKNSIPMNNTLQNQYCEPIPRHRNSEDISLVTKF